jgi:glutamate dehydrogenase (NAD(P)+)
VALQGFGNVGSVFARFVVEAGARVVAVTDASGGRHDPAGLDLERLLAHKAAGGKLAELDAGDRIGNEELLELPCDVLAPCALELVITEENAPRVKAGVVVEGANGPVSPAADAILEANGIAVVPDVLANAGGVVVSYFEWVQGLQELFWSEAEVNERLRGIVGSAFADTWELHERRGISLRTAAYGIAVQRVAEASTIRGLYP